MEPELKNTFLTNNNLNRITSFSKYLALLLLIILPFLGGWVGYNIAPEKIIDTKEVITVEVEKETVQPFGEQNSWYLHIEDKDFSLLVPEPYQVVPIVGGIKITDGTDLVEGYSIFYQEDVVNEEQAIDFAKRIYGSDCDVLPAYPEEKYRTIYEPRDYFVLEPNKDLAHDERGQNNCDAFKVTFLYEPYGKRVLTWHTFMEPVMPITENAYMDWQSSGKSLSESFADFKMLNSIEFEF